MIKALAWDMDGTLLNTLDDIIDAVNETLVAYQLPQVPKSQMTQYIGYGARFLCQSSSKLEGGALDAFVKDYRERCLKRMDPKTYIYPGVQEILIAAKKNGLKLGINTNKPQFWCEILTERFFGNDMFDAIYGVTPDAVALKPDPWALLEMAKQWGIQPCEILMIGDSPVDWQTAQNAKAQSACVSWGFRSRAVLEQAGAPCIVDTSAQLSAVIQKQLLACSVVPC